MKLNSPVALVVGTALGAAVVYGIISLNRPQIPAPEAAPAAAPVDRSALEAANKRIDELENRLKQKEIEKAPTPTPEERAKDPEAAAQADVRGLLQDSKPLLNRLAPLFQDGVKRMIDRQIDTLASRYGLTEDQKTKLRAKLQAMSDEEFKKFNDRLNDPKITPDKLFQPGANPLSPEALKVALKETMTADQYAAYEKQETEDRVKRLETQANWQTENLGQRLGLSEAQKDEIFGIMVKSSDPSLAVETESGAGNNAPQNPDQEAAIRAVLTEDQAKTYDADNQRNAEMRNRWMQFFGGAGGPGGGGGGRGRNR